MKQLSVFCRIVNFNDSLIVNYREIPISSVAAIRLFLLILNVRNLKINNLASIITEAVRTRLVIGIK